jgi:hypothetical protein
MSQQSHGCAPPQDRILTIFSAVACLIQANHAVLLRCFGIVHAARSTPKSTAPPQVDRCSLDPRSSDLPLACL